MSAVLCHHAPCREPGLWAGTHQNAFCPAHHARLTPHKQQLVLSIAHLSVLHPDSRRRALAIIRECRLYLLSREKRRAA